MTDNIAYHELPAHAFPFTLQLVNEITGAVVWEIEVTGPGAIMVPSLRHLGVPVVGKVIWPDGSSQTEGDI